MKSAKELIARLQSDEAFSKEYTEAVKAKQESGIKDVYEIIIPVAAQFGYDVTKKDIDEIQASANDELSEEELGKVAGGTCLFAAVTVGAVLLATGVAATIKEEIDKRS